MELLKQRSVYTPFICTGLERHVGEGSWRLDIEVWLQTPDGWSRREHCNEHSSRRDRGHWTGYAGLVWWNQRLQLWWQKLCPEVMSLHTGIGLFSILLHVSVISEKLVSCGVGGGDIKKDVMYKMHVMYLHMWIIWTSFTLCLSIQSKAWRVIDLFAWFVLVKLQT